MAEALPSFDDACASLRALLESVGRSTDLVWAFREDLFALGPGNYVVRTPPPEENAALARRYYERFRSAGALELRAICALEEQSLATPFSPFELEGGIQGFEAGFRANVQRPWSRAFPVRSGAAWWVHRRRPIYKRFQAHGIGIPLRSRVEAAPA